MADLATQLDDDRLIRLRANADALLDFLDDAWDRTDLARTPTECDASAPEALFRIAAADAETACRSLQRLTTAIAPHIVNSEERPSVDLLRHWLAHVLAFSMETEHRVRHHRRS